VDVKRFLLCLVLASFLMGRASAADIIDQWSSVTAPPAPPLETMTVDPKTTAVLALDFVKQTCNEKDRPRCLASLPAVARLLKKARDAKALVIYSGVVTATVDDILPPVAPLAGDPYVKSHADKFIDTNLDQLLKAKGIQTVIVTGTTAQGAVLYTASHAALVGYNVIVPVDGMSAESLYPEQYVAWDMLHSPIGKAHLTRIDMLTF
jgi:nicotinamidase-related amidase